MNLLYLFFPLALLLFSTSTIAQVQSLCEKNERVVWSCRAGIKYYSLCASGDLSSSSGYMQYRAGRRGAIEFRFPADQQHPRNYFKYRLLPHGAALTIQEWWVLVWDIRRPQGRTLHRGLGAEWEVAIYRLR